MADNCHTWTLSVFHAATLNSAPDTIQWTEHMTAAFRDLKAALTSDDFTSGILVQKHGSHHCPVAFCSSALPPVVQGMPACLKAVAATAFLIEKSAPIVMGYVMCKVLFLMLFSIFCTLAPPSM
uniref:Reverse transcriptase/retrotransposon-derived protein RNase H-like domain-containing protein n=1 Tax=Seriola lalandi dorsalis TaxID=1841481 RepID=A0A3B4XKC5_SERLL